jgi:hypothetical protein
MEANRERILGKEKIFGRKKKGCFYEEVCSFGVCAAMKKKGYERKTSFKSALR